MWLWVLRILITAALIYCFSRYYELIQQARYHKLPHAKDEDLPWDMTDKLLTDEGKALASDGRLWAIPTLVLWIMCGVLWMGMK